MKTLMLFGKKNFKLTHKYVPFNLFFRCASISRLYPCQSLGHWVVVSNLGKLAHLGACELVDV